jgi:YgiT-type zinc finger domain-containing protein
MKCVICKNGQTHKGFVNVSIQRNNSVVIVKEVRAEICDNCGEYYLDENMTAKVLKKAQQAVRNGAEVEILKMQ